ncbi:THAP domain-containing 9, partial, partial [Paramuricea clavata]
VIKNSQADAVEELKGMADDVNGVTLALEKDEVLSLQVISDSEITTIDSVSIQEVSEEVISEDNVSIQGRKRKHSDEIVFDSNCVSNEVSSSQKRARTTSSCDKAVRADHTYCIKSPRRMKRRLDDVVDNATILKKRLESSQKKLRRYRGKVSTLTTVVSELKEQNLINNDCATILETTFSGVSRELMKRLVTQKVKKNPGAYPPELRSFAMTLKFYSTKAYNYVRKSFDLGLPHVSVIRSWYSSMNGEPGFTKNALAALKVKVLAAKENRQEVVCALMLDEMSIRKHVEWDGKQFRGYVDLGTGINDDSLPEATDALVFMAVSVNSGWKVPCGYFLVNGLTGEQKANLTKECITKLHEVGVKVVSLTCDGPTSHQAMLKLLGAQLSPDGLQAFFQHPCDPKAKIYILLDACHMIKLVRNTMSDWGILKDKDGKVIRWQFLVQLQELQESEGLHLANKLRSAHIKWKPQKMKVNLAAQALSSSVADALEYCEGKLKLPQFQGCGPTVKFIRVFDRLFDVLNSRNPLARNFKAPIRKSNYQYTKSFLDEATEYIRNLKTSDGQSILTSKRKTGFLGFLLCINAVVGLTEDLVNAENPVLKYLLTYKMSQDHLELFFSAVRACGGWNNNPTTRQFIAAYKQLMMRHNIEGGRGNCTPQDDTEILNSVQDQHEINSLPTGISDVAIARRYDLTLRPPAADDHDYCDVSNAMELSEYKEAAISYIAGYVVRMVEKKIHCPQCIAALTTNKENIPDLFVTWKTNGGLRLPSLGLIKICEETEKCIMRMLNVNGGGLPHSTGLSNAIASTVLSVCVERRVFSTLDEHMFDSAPGNNHTLSLIKCCSQSYVTIRMHHLSKLRNARMHDK